MDHDWTARQQVGAPSTCSRDVASASKRLTREVWSVRVPRSLTVYLPAHVTLARAEPTDVSYQLFDVLRRGPSTGR